MATIILSNITIVHTGEIEISFHDKLTIAKIASFFKKPLKGFKFTDENICFFRIEPNDTMFADASNLDDYITELRS